MSERHGLGLAGGPVNAAHILAPWSGLDRGAKELDRGGPPVALVAGHLVSGAADGSQSALAQNHIPEDTVGVGPLDAVQVDDGALRRRDALPRVLLDLAPLVGAGGAVDDEGEGVVGRDAERQGVGAQHGLDAEGRGDGGTGVGSRQADASGLGGHRGVVPGDAVVGGILHGDETDAVLLGLLDGHVHGVRADVQAEAEVAVEEGGGLRLLEDVDGLVGEQDAVVHAVAVNGLQSAKAVAVDAALVRFDEDVGADLGPLRRHPVREEHLVHELLHVVKVDDGVGFLFAATAVRRLGLLGRRRDGHAVDGRADGEQDVGGVDIVGGGVGLELVGEGGAEGGVEMASGVRADEAEQFGPQFGGGRHGIVYGGKRVGKSAQKCEEEEQRKREDGVAEW